MIARDGWRARFRYYLLSCILVLSPGRLFAQYYEPREYTPSEVRYFSAGFFFRDFSPRSSNLTPDSAAIDFKRVMPVIGYSQGSTDIAFGYTRYTLRGITRTTIFLSVAIGQDIPLAGGRPSALVMPLVIAADFTKAEGIGLERENFDIGSVGLGAGLKYRYVGPAVEFSIGAIEAAQFSSEGFSVGSGFSALTLAQATLMLRGALVLNGIVMGYRFRYQTWSMSDSQFDYRSLSHGPFIGILF